MNELAIVALTVLAMCIAWIVYASISDAIYVKRETLHDARLTRRVADLPPVPSHREVKREQARRDIDEWTREYRRLLPPAPPCASTEHDHVEIVRWGGQVVGRVCQHTAREDAS